MAKSKWISDELFAKFKAKTIEEAEKKTTGNFSDLKWETPDKGTFEKPISYTIRLLPDSSRNFYKKMFYHMYKVGDKWSFSICPKTFDLEAYCPVCSVTTKLYKSGSESDKTEAYQYKRKEKFITNILVVNDPRDQDRDDNLKNSGKVKLWEFPSAVEQIIRSSMLDSENGVGKGSYDPGDGGYNFILKVGSKKPQADGKVWPDYTTSTFGRNSSAIGDNDDEIEAILEKTINLDEYLRKQLPKEENIIKELKEQLVFDLIQDEYNKLRGITSNSSKQTTKEHDKYDEDEQNEEVQEDTKKVSSKSESSEPKSSKKSSYSSDIDEELLAELNDL